MYLPPAFSADAGTAWSLIASNPLAQLVIVGPNGLEATPLPMIRRGDRLVGHLARANPVANHAGPALAIFTGADAYVSPGWYPSKAELGKVVPTWNYTTVQVRGTLTPVHDRGWKLALVTELTEIFEAGQARPWSVTDAPSDFIEAMLNGIVGLELTDLTVTPKVKLSQNRPAADRLAVRAALAAGNPVQAAVAGEMPAT